MTSPAFLPPDAHLLYEPRRFAMIRTTRAPCRAPRQHAASEAAIPARTASAADGLEPSRSSPSSATSSRHLQEAHRTGAAASSHRPLSRAGLSRFRAGSRRLQQSRQIAAAATMIASESKLRDDRPLLRCSSSANSASDLSTMFARLPVQASIFLAQHIHLCLPARLVAVPRGAGGRSARLYVALDVAVAASGRAKHRCVYRGGSPLGDRVSDDEPKSFGRRSIRSLTCFRRDVVVRLRVNR